MNLNSVLLVLTPVFPLLLAMGLMTGLLRKTALILAPVAALPALVLAFTIEPSITVELSWLLFGSSLTFDDTARYFMLFTSLLWLVAGVYSVGYFSDHSTRKRFFIWFLLAMAGNLGLILAQDLALYYTLFALMSFASYGLVVHDRTQDALHAGRIYIILVVIGEILLFVAFALAAQAANSIDFSVVRSAIASAEMRDWIIGLTLLGFGIKAGVIGLHVWLPLAHPVAPTPASAVLSGAMIAAGLLGWLRVLPLGETTLTTWGEILVIVGMASTYYAVLVGITQKKAKAVLAYSSISKMGIMTMGVGLGFIAPQSWSLLLTAILIFVLHHGLVKGALFLGVGMVSLPPVSKIQRLLLIAGLLLTALSLAGAPFTSGMLAKQMFKEPMLSLPSSPLLNGISILLTLSAIATTLLMVRFLYLVWPKDPLKQDNEGQPRTMWVSWLLLVAIVVVSPLLILFAPLISPLIPSLFNDVFYWSLPMLISASWPILVGGIIVALVWWVNKKRLISSLLSVPQGDILVLIEKLIFPFLVSSVFFLIINPATKISLLKDTVFDALNNNQGKNTFLTSLSYSENQLGRWTVSLTLFLLAGGLLVLLLIR